MLRVGKRGKLQVGIGVDGRAVHDKLCAERRYGKGVVVRQGPAGSHGSRFAQAYRVGYAHVRVFGVAARQQLHQVGQAVGLQLVHRVAPDDRLGDESLRLLGRDRHFAEAEVGLQIHIQGRVLGKGHRASVRLIAHIAHFQHIALAGHHVNGEASVGIGQRGSGMLALKRNGGCGKRALVCGIGHDTAHIDIFLARTMQRKPTEQHDKNIF